MLSLRTLILGMALTILSIIQFSSATPVPSSDCSLPSRPVSTTPTLPLSGDATELPAAPPAGQSLVVIALGRGVQNYTCVDTTSTPVALGAVATLFDGTALATINESAFNALPPKAVYVPLNSPIFSDLPVLGHHYFIADGTPTFNISAKGDILYAKKTADIKAPSTANAGPAGTGAVDWLTLVAKPGYPSVGLQTVYRVVTAGGNPPTTCPSAGVISVQYSAEYWFYG